MYDSILVPTDGSEHARRAAEHARVLARRFDAAVDVLTVIDLDEAAGPFSAGGLDAEHVDRLEADAAEVLEDVEALLGEDVTVRTESVRGQPTKVIPQYVADNDIDAVAMGTHGRTGIQRFVSGSVTESVLRKSAVPVLTVRATERSVPEEGYDEIMIPTDGSDPATVAVEHGIEFARAFDARVHAVNVVDMGVLSRGSGESFPTELLSALRDAGEAATESVVESARAEGLDAVAEVRDGFPAEALLDYAEEADVDMIVMGTAGQTGLSRFLLGSTTERVIRHAEVPVLAVNARTRE